MTLWRRLERGSLALRLVGLFTLGGLVVFLLVGASLSLLLRAELRARDLAEIDSKTIVVEHHLMDVRTADDLQRNLSRFVDTSVGHANLRLGVMLDRTWLLRPEEGIDDLLEGRAVESIPTQSAFEMVRSEGRTWWLRRVERALDDGSGRKAQALIAIDVSDTQRVRDRFGVALLLIGAGGILLMAGIAWLATRRGLAPLQRVASDAQRVTAERLGEPLSIAEAPDEIRGVVAAINRMMARIADSFQSLEQFSADIAHELRTPLNSLMLRVEVTLSRDRTDDEYRDALQETMEELGQLQKMVSDMLFIARAERGMATLNRDVVDLLSETRDVAEYFEPLATDRAVAIRIEGSGAIVGDRVMTRRVITNLFSNAVRYSLPDSAIEVSISQDGEGARLAMTNRCEPMTQAQAEHLFDRFVRGEWARGRQPEGAGLGLAIVRSVMALHHASATARATAQGLVVELRWPSRG